LIGYWPLHEDSGSTAYDFSGNNYDGTVSGVTKGTTGLLGTTCYNFDGSDDYVDLGSNPFSNNEAITFSCWVYVDTDASHKFLDIGNERYHVGYKHRGSTGYEFRMYDGSNHLLEYSTNIDQWIHITTVFDGDGQYLYINGSQVASATGTGWTDAEGDWWLGTDYQGEATLNGKLWDVRIYNRGLSSSEIQALYNVVNNQGSLTTSTKSS